MLALSPSLPRAAFLAVLLVLPARLGMGQERVRESRSVVTFTKIEYAIPGTLHLRQGEPSSVEIDAPQRVLGRVETTVDGDVLDIRAKDESGFFDRWFRNNDLSTDEIDVYVTAPTLEDVTVAGSGRVEGEAPLRTESLSLHVAGSGGMTLEVDVDDLQVQVAGAGDYTLRGQASSMDVNVAGSGDLRAAGVEVQRAEVRIAGSGDAELYVTNYLSAEILGSGDVRYRGRPAIETSTVGSGEVGPLGDE